MLKGSKLTSKVSKLTLNGSKLTLNVSKLTSLLHDDRTPACQFISIVLLELVPKHRSVIFLVPFFNEIMAEDQLPPALQLCSTCKVQHLNIKKQTKSNVEVSHTG
jgi:hypothetical protein